MKKIHFVKTAAKSVSQLIDTPEFFRDMEKINY